MRLSLAAACVTAGSAGGFAVPCVAGAQVPHRTVAVSGRDDLIPAFENPLLTDPWQVAFEALITGPPGEFGRGIWATDQAGVLRLVAHTGQDFVVGPGDVRVVELLKLNGGEQRRGDSVRIQRRRRACVRSPIRGRL